MNADEIEDVLAEFVSGVDTTCHWDSFWSYLEDKGTVVVPELGTFHVVSNDRDRLSNDEGDPRVLVFEWDGNLWAKRGTWVSHDGMYWDGPLTPVKKGSITFETWEPVE